MNQTVYIFDVDGVINDIHTYEADERVLSEISRLLNAGCFVAFNTGRGYAWVEEDVIAYLRKQPGASSNLNRVFVSAEMGGITVEFADGVEHRENTAFSLLPEQIQKVKEIYEQHHAPEGVMHWYAGKMSMATVYKPAGIKPEVFLDEGDKLAAKLHEAFADEHVKIKLNPDAIDVTTPEAGKWAGAQLIHDWLQRTPAAGASHFVCFGDNGSDYEMARFFAHQDHTIELVFTGKSLDGIDLDPKVHVIQTAKLYNEGTYEYLKSQS